MKGIKVLTCAQLRRSNDPKDVLPLFLAAPWKQALRACSHVWPTEITRQESQIMGTSRVLQAAWSPHEHQWVAVKELKLSYYIGETPLFTTYIYIYIYTHYGNLV